MLRSFATLAIVVVVCAACGAPQQGAHVIARLATNDCAAGASTGCDVDAGNVPVLTDFVAAFDVVNDGDADTTLTNVSLTGDPSFVVDQAPATTLRAGASSPLAWSVAPSVGGPVASVLSIGWDGPGGSCPSGTNCGASGGTIAIQLSAFGLSGIRPSPSSCEFGDVAVGTTSAPCALHFDNTTGVEQQIDQLEFAETSVVFASVGGLVVLPMVLAPRASLDIAITATPTQVGPVTGELSLRQGTTIFTFGLTLNVNGT